MADKEFTLFEKTEFAKQIANELDIDLIEELRKQLERDKKRASGKLIDSLSYKMKQVLTVLNLEFTYETYGKFVEGGATYKKGKIPPIKAIKEYCKIKGIDEKFAYPIAKNIYKFGIKPTPFVSDVLKNNISINGAVSKISTIFEKEVELEFIKLINDINNKNK